MHFLGLLLLTVAKVLRLLINLSTFIVAIAVIVGWVGADPYNPIVRFLNQITRPVFGAIRRRMPRALFRTGLDLSPLILFVLLIAFDTIVVGLLFEYSSVLLSK